MKNSNNKNLVKITDFCNAVTENTPKTTHINIEEEKDDFFFVYLRTQMNDEQTFYNVMYEFYESYENRHRFWPKTQSVIDLIFQPVYEKQQLEFIIQDIYQKARINMDSFDFIHKSDFYKYLLQCKKPLNIDSMKKILSSHPYLPTCLNYNIDLFILYLEMQTKQTTYLKVPFNKFLQHKPPQYSINKTREIFTIHQIKDVFFLASNEEQTLVDIINALYQQSVDYMTKEFNIENKKIKDESRKDSFEDRIKFWQKFQFCDQLLAIKHWEKDVKISEQSILIPHICQIMKRSENQMMKNINDDELYCIYLRCRHLRDNDDISKILLLAFNDSKILQDI
eukprot:33708_1